MITLQQDSGSKKSITLPEDTILSEVKRFFKWRKNVTVKRLQSIGTSDYNKFIQYLIDRS